MSRRHVKKLNCDYDLFEEFKKLVVREIAAIGRKKVENSKEITERYEDTVMRLSEKLRNIEKEFEAAEEVEIQFNVFEVRLLQGLIKAYIPKLFDRKEAYEKRSIVNKVNEVDNELALCYHNIDLLGRLI